MLTTNIQFSDKSFSDIAHAMERAEKETGRDIEDVLTWTGIKITASLSAATKIAPKLRKLAKNPDPRVGKDRRVAPFGVWRLKTDGTRKFVPIGRTGEFGGIRFISKTTGEMLSRTSTGVHRTRFSLDEFAAAGGTAVKNNPRRRIGRRGLAKKSWRGLGKRMNTGGSVSIGDAKGIGNVRRIKAARQFGIVITNDLRYIQDAIIPGKIEHALTAAAQGMEYQMDKKLDRPL